MPHIKSTLSHVPTYPPIWNNVNHDTFDLILKHHFWHKVLYFGIPMKRKIFYHRVRINGLLFAICKCKFAFCECKIIIHFANVVLQKQYIKVYIKGWFLQSLRICFTICKIWSILLATSVFFLIILGGHLELILLAMTSYIDFLNGKYSFSI